MNDNRYHARIFVLLIDFILIDICIKLAYQFRFGTLSAFEDYYLFFFIFFNASWLGVSLFCGSYKSDNIFEFRPYLRTASWALVMHMIVVALYILYFDNYFFSRIHILYSYAGMLMAMVFFRFLMSLAYAYYRSISYNIRKIVVVGSGNSSKALYDFFVSQEATVFKFLHDVSPHISEEEYEALAASKLQELKDLCLTESISEIYFSLPLHTSTIIDEMSEFADDNFIHFRIISSFNVLEKRAVNIDLFGHIPIITLRKEPLKVLVNRIMKRAFDVVFSSLVILFVYPIIFPLIAAAIRIESKGPIIFKQKRSGVKNEDFTVYKFRTMALNDHANDTQATKGDARITKVGAFLRRTSLDEFPQFINVLKGHMSVVGPRPHMLKHTEEYSQVIEKYLFRHFITPGITGYAQINGFRGETTNPDLMQKRIEYDTWYIENWSLVLDVKIILKTVWNALRGEENAF